MIYMLGLVIASCTHATCRFSMWAGLNMVFYNWSARPRKGSGNETTSRLPNYALQILEVCRGPRVDERWVVRSATTEIASATVQAQKSAMGMHNFGKLWSHLSLCVFLLHSINILWWMRLIAAVSGWRCFSAAFTGQEESRYTIDTILATIVALQWGLINLMGVD